MWTKLLSKQRVLATVKERAWSGIDTLERVVRRLCMVVGFRLTNRLDIIVCILYKTVAAATLRLYEAGW
jgi:hypothetical protein